MNETNGMADPSLVRARWLAGTAGFLVAAAAPVLLLFACAVARIVGLRMHDLLYGKPLPALTAFFFDSAGYLLGAYDKPWPLGLLSIPFLLVYLPLLFAVRRAGSAATISLIFSVWLGLLLSVELLVAGLMTLALLLPWLTTTVSLHS